MKRKGIINLTISCLTVFLAAWVCIAAVESQVTIKGALHTGDVNISLEEYEVNAVGIETSYKNPKKVLPGSVISKIPRITNLGEDCYVRVRLIFDNNQQGLEGIDEDNLIGIDSSWVKRGDYYYYQPILKKGKSVDLFEKVFIPAEWGNEHRDQELTLTIDADAIQAVHFSPEYENMSPWLNVPIEKCIHEADGLIRSEKELVKLSVVLERDSGKLVAVPEDFFENLPEIMPGDCLEDRILIQNQTEEEAEIFFWTETQGTEEEVDLLKHLELELYLNDSVIYKGNLLSEELKKEVSLGNYQPGAKSEILFRITAPKELNNVYARRKAEVEWHFRTGAAAASLGNPALGGTGGTGKDSIATGDDSPWRFLLLLLIVSGISILTVSYYRGGQREKHEE